MADPHDPLAPRPDDPRIGACWRGARSGRGGLLSLRGSLWMVLMLLVVSFVALGVQLDHADLLRQRSRELLRTSAPRSSHDPTAIVRE